MRRILIGIAAGVLMLSVSAAKAAEWPSIVEAKDIAEEGFIYGLPIVMNYAVMYEYAVDKDSGQFKAPFNEIKNEARVFTYKDTAVVTPNSDTPYSFAGWTCAPSPWSCPSPRSRRTATTRCSSRMAIRSTTAISAAAPLATRRATTWSSVPTGRARRRAGIKKVFRSSTQFSIAGYRTQLFDPDDIET